MSKKKSRDGSYTPHLNKDIAEKLKLLAEEGGTTVFEQLNRLIDEKAAQSIAVKKAKDEEEKSIFKQFNVVMSVYYIKRIKDILKDTNLSHGEYITSLVDEDLLKRGIK